MRKSLNFTPVFRSIGKSLTKHRPAILTGLGVAGMLTGAVTAVRVTPKALKLIEASEQEKGEELTKTEKVKATWKCYILPATVEAVSAMCIIAGSREQYRRHAALAAAYTLSETALKGCVDKVREIVTPEQFEEIQDKIAEDKIKKTPVKSKEIIFTKKGNTLCCDTISGRYFMSDIDSLKKVENELNKRLRTENTITVNELYDELDLEHTSVGGRLGWDIDYGYLEMGYTSKLTPDGEPCIVVQYWNPPRYLE